MKTLIGKGRSLWSSNGGATAIEYALIASLVAVVIIGSLLVLGGQLSNKYNDISTAVESAST